MGYRRGDAVSVHTNEEKRGLPPESLSDMIAPGQRHDRRAQETRMDDKKRKNTHAR